MTKHRDAKRDGESISDWIERVSYRDDNWLKKAKRRILECIIFKKKFK